MPHQVRQDKLFGHFVSYLNRLGNIYETRNFSFVVELSSAGRNKQACFFFTRLIRFHVKHNRGQKAKKCLHFFIC